MFRKVSLGILFVLLLIVVGCTNSKKTTTSNTTTTSSTTTTTTEETTQTVIDMANRQVVIPKNITKVVSNIPSGTMLLYTIDPDILGAWNYEFNDYEIEYIPEKYRDLPVIGQANKINKEKLISLQPDFILAYNSLSSKEVDDANQLAHDTGIPVIMIDHSLDKVPDAYRFLKTILISKQSRCEELAQYAETALAFANSIDIPENERVKVYYGNGPDSLETVPEGSSHAALFELLDVYNVARDDDIKGETRYTVNPEHIITWMPDVVIVNGEPTEGVSPKQAVERFLSNENYQGIPAVQNNRVYAIPKYPFSWFDRPQSANRLIGIYWLADLLYDNLPDGMNIEQETKNFYKLFYHLDLTDEQVDYLLGK